MSSGSWDASPAVSGIGARADSVYDRTTEILRHPSGPSVRMGADAGVPGSGSPNAFVSAPHRCGVTRACVCPSTRRRKLSGDYGLLVGAM